jgi:hypothetical protein
MGFKPKLKCFGTLIFEEYSRKVASGANTSV